MSIAYEDRGTKGFTGSRWKRKETPVSEFSQIHCAVLLSEDEATAATNIAKSLGVTLGEFLRLALFDFAERLGQPAPPLEADTSSPAPDESPARG